MSRVCPVLEDCPRISPHLVSHVSQDHRRLEAAPRDDNPTVAGANVTRSLGGGGGGRLSVLG